MALHIVEESERCLGCKRPGCQGGLPGRHASTADCFPF